MIDYWVLSATNILFNPSLLTLLLLPCCCLCCRMHCTEMQNALNEIESLKKERNELNDKVKAYEKSLEVMCTIKTTDLEEEEER